VIASATPIFVWRTEGVLVIKLGRLRKIDKSEAPTQTEI